MYKKGKKRRVKSHKKKRSARKTFESGGRIEAYTFGEAQRSKKWP